MELRPSIVSSFVVPIVLAGSGILAADWPGFRGPGSDGAVADARLFDGDSVALEVGWKRTLGAGYSSLAVGEGRVVAMFADGDADFVAAFDVESGDELWRYRISETYGGHDGSHDGPISTPLLAGGRVYGLGAWGHLFAVDATSGREVWTSHLADDHGSAKPHYGFSTSPLMVDGVLVLELGAAEGTTIAGLDPDDGSVLWTAGDDTIEYHSPVVAEIGGRRQVLAAGQNRIYGLEPKTGKVLWSHEHAGDERAMGGMTVVPVTAGENRVFLMNKVDSSVMLGVTPKKRGKYEISELWSSGSLKQSYVTPVYHEGHLYGMSNRIFTCVDAATGEIVWRSREPGDGFPTLVGEHLVIMTKPGSLHVAEASPEGYRELAGLELFDEHSWSEVAYAGGRLFARSMAQLARIDLVSGTPAGAGERLRMASGEFGRFLADVEGSRSKGAVIDEFLGRQASFPIIDETGAAHFLYRGPAEDVGIVGDMIGYRREDPMVRLAGTDLFHYSTRLEPDAAVTYGFIPDYGEPVADPLNPALGDGLFGEVSWFAMPAWEAPDFLEEAEASRQGRLQTLTWTSEAREGQERSAEVYLPAGYDDDDDRYYPVIYVHHGKKALEAGGLKNSLDQLIDVSLEPLIAVFIVADEDNPRRDMSNENYSRMIVEELVPRIDAEFRTVAEPMARASVGSGRAGNAAVTAAFKHSDVFGRTAAQSATLGPESLRELVQGPDVQPMVIYLEWGTYHMRSPHEAWDLAVESRKLWAELREAGYRPAGGEVPEGFGWACWRGHTDEMLAALFPLR